MAPRRYFAYDNSGSTVPSTTRVGNLLMSTADLDYYNNYGGLKWWPGPDEDLGWIITHQVPSGDQPSEAGENAFLGFWRSKGFSNPSFIALAEYVSRKNGTPQTFANANDAKNWLESNGYYTNEGDPLPSLTPTASPTTTPTQTPTNTPPARFVFSPVSASTYGVSCQSTSGVTIYGTNSVWSSNTEFYNNSSGPVTIDMTGYYNLSGEVWSLNSSGQALSLFLCPTPTETPSPTETPTPTPTATETQPPPTPNETETPTPTPTITPEPVTGYSFNLVALPYNFPSSGNTIMNGAGGATSGTTEPNVLATGSRGIYWNSIDSDGIDRTDYFSGFTGQSITITMSQTGSTAIYSGDTSSLKTWTAATGNGFVFGAGIGVPPPPSTPSGTAVLIQSASTQWTIGLPVYISVVLNGGATPTPTPTQTTTPTETQPPPTPNETETPTPTPTATETQPPPTPNETETPTPTPTATETQPPPTPTPTPTNTSTPTVTPSSTSAPACDITGNIIEPTPTPTPTNTETPTVTPTNTLTPTNTETPTQTPTVTPTATMPFTLKVESALTGVTVNNLIGVAGFTYTLTSGSFPITNSVVTGTHSSTGVLATGDVLLTFDASTTSNFTITKNGVELVNFPASSGIGQTYQLGSQFSNLLTTDVMILKFS